jgi:mycoredoxin
MENTITIYGTWWCGDCTRARRFFDKNNIAYIWIDVDQDASAEEFVLLTNHGMRSVPTILLEDGSILVEPTDAELQKRLGTALSAN